VTVIRESRAVDVARNVTNGDRQQEALPTPEPQVQPEDEALPTPEPQVQPDQAA
jgi:hypothetical protein